MAEGPIHINPPNTTSAEELSAGVFPYDKFMGTWNVVWSTLPLWKVRDGGRACGYNGLALSTLFRTRSRISKVNRNRYDGD